MLNDLPKDIRDGLEAARRLALRKSSRLRVESGGQSYRVLRLWDNGFAMEAEGAPHLRGLVALFDGTRQVSQCLIIASSEENGEMQFEFKWSSAALDHAPLDFVREESAPIALLGR